MLDLTLGGFDRSHSTCKQWEENVMQVNAAADKVWLGESLRGITE